MRVSAQTSSIATTLCLIQAQNISHADTELMHLQSLINSLSASHTCGIPMVLCFQHDNRNAPCYLNNKAYRLPNLIYHSLHIMMSSTPPLHYGFNHSAIFAFNTSSAAGHPCPGLRQNAFTSICLNSGISCSSVSTTSIH